MILKVGIEVSTVDTMRSRLILSRWMLGMNSGETIKREKSVKTYVGWESFNKIY
jgi:hypothetical protein